MSRGNIAKELENQTGSEAVNTVSVRIQHAYRAGGDKLITYAITAITAESALTALCEIPKEIRFATNCIVQSVSSLATLTCIWVNTGTTPSAPSFVAVNSIAY